VPEKSAYRRCGFEDRDFTDYLVYQELTDIPV